MTIPIALVTGFLGCGKTTLLKELVKRYDREKIVYLVNEFSPTDVDAKLVSRDAERVVSVAGGSIFCKCLVGTFIKELNDIVARYHRPDDPIRGVIIEASGMADPKVIQQMLRETQLDRQYSLRSIVTVVDPGSFHKLLVTLPNIVAQVQAADTVIINKIDRCTPDQSTETRDKIITLNPDARILETRYCRAQIDVFAESRFRNLQGEYAKCVDPNYARLEVAFDKPIAPDKLKAEIESRGEEIYRVKGAVPVDDKKVYVDYSIAGLTFTDGSSLPTGLIFILKGSASAETRQAIQTLPQRV